MNFPGSAAAGTAEAALAPFGRSKCIDKFQRHFRKFCNHHLRDPVAAPDREGFLPVIEDDHPDFAAIAGVDGSRRIGQSDVVLQRQSATGANLRLESRRQLQKYSGRDQYAAANRKLHVAPAAQIKGGVITVRPGRNQVVAAGRHLYLKFDFTHFPFKYL